MGATWRVVLTSRVVFERGWKTSNKLVNFLKMFIIILTMDIQNPIATALAPLIVIKAGDRRLPIWPTPSKIRGVDLLTFCPAVHRAAIKNKFVIHFHQHPEIPFDAQGTHLSASEIHEGAVFDMYEYCRQHDLSQVWAYMWNCWYNPTQWLLWARSAALGIPRLKTTMVSESQWKVIKHNDLTMFNRPRLDLVIHVLINRLSPRVHVTLADVLGMRRQARAASPNDWQQDFQAEWLDMSKPDELRNIECQLEILKSGKKTKACTAKLAELKADELRPKGTYHTNINRWTCSCPSYLISRFLLCKHLICTANTAMTGFNLKDNLTFFAALRRNHFPPFYFIPALHKQLEPAETTASMELPMRKVLRTLDNTVTDLLLKTDITGGIGPEGAVGGAVSGLTEEHEHGTPTVECCHTMYVLYSRTWRKVDK
jgi:SWIM zinc finger